MTETQAKRKVTAMQMVRQYSAVTDNDEYASVVIDCDNGDRIAVDVKWPDGGMIAHDFATILRCLEQELSPNG